MKRLIPVLLFAVISVAICTAQAQIRNFHQEGLGSQDIVTEELTITHPSLPFGSQVRVTNPENEKEVIATVVGRIPASTERIADLSTGVAKGLALPLQGSAPIILELVDARRAPSAVAVVTPPPTQSPPAVVTPLPTQSPPAVVTPLLPQISEPPLPPASPQVSEPPLPPVSPAPPRVSEPPLPPASPQVSEPPLPPVSPAPPPPPEPLISMADTNTDTNTNTNIDTNTDTNTKADTNTSTDNSTDTRNQTTAPVSAQSPNINIYNTIMSPNSFATDSAPVNTTGAQDLANAGTSDGNGARPAGIIAVAPSSNVSSSKQAVTPLPIMPPLEPAAPQPTRSSSPPAPPPQQVQQPLQLKPASMSSPADIGTALIKPYMPNPQSGKIYRVQVGAFVDTWRAKEAFDYLTTVGFKPSYERYKNYIRVVIPGIRAADMSTVARLIGKVGFREALIREEN